MREWWFVDVSYSVAKGACVPKGIVFGNYYSIVMVEEEDGDGSPRETSAGGKQLLKRSFRMTI